jgi:hypothetical protein
MIEEQRKKREEKNQSFLKRMSLGEKVDIKEELEGIMNESEDLFEESFND